MGHAPTSPLVTVAWLKSRPGIPAGVATARPVDSASWAATGFLVVTVVGSSGVRDLSEQRKPIIAVDAWGTSPSSSKPPKNQTAGLLELVRREVESFSPVILPVGTGYDQALIQDAWMETQEPRDIPDPDGSMAHYSIDIGLAWVRVS